jgi:hypothetical protein
VRRAGREAPLRSREFDLLTFLLHHPGRVLTRAQLLARVWAGPAAGPPPAARWTCTCAGCGRSWRPTPPPRPCWRPSGGVGYRARLPRAAPGSRPRAPSPPASPEPGAR